MKSPDANKRLAKNTMLLYIRMIFILIISLYTTRVVLNVLGVEDYGIYNVVCGFVSMFTIFNTCFSASINRFYNYELGKRNTNGVTSVYNISLIIQGTLACVVFLVVECVGLWYLTNKMTLDYDRLAVAHWIFQFSVASLVITIIQAPYIAAVMAYERMDFYAIVSIIDALLKLSLIILLKYIDTDKLLFYGILMFTISVVDFLLYLFYCKHKFSELKFHKGINKSMFKSLMSFSGWNLLDPFSYMVRDQGTNMVLNSFFGTIVNAAQGVAYQISSAVEAFTSSLSTSFRPQIIQTYSEGNYERTKKLVFSMSRLNYMLQLLLAIPLCYEINFILQLWLGDGIPNYTPIFAILVLSNKTINTLNLPISILVLATGKIKQIKIISSIIVCSVLPIAVVLFSLGLPPWSVYASLISVTIINQIACVIIMNKLFPFIGLWEYFKLIALPCFRYTVCSCIFPTIMVSCFEESFTRLIINVIMSVLLILLFGYYTILNSDEKKYIVDLVKK
jgi:O-antigen/teichoic acid export membrane protein